MGIQPTNHGRGVCCCGQGQAHILGQVWGVGLHLYGHPADTPRAESVLLRAGTGTRLWAGVGRGWTSWICQSVHGFTSQNEWLHIPK
eukprot:365652-Chlamydomonas_euryale.AAC.4